MSNPTSKSARRKAARRAEDAVMAWLRGDADHVVLTRNPDGSRHVSTWERAKPETPIALGRGK